MLSSIKKLGSLPFLTSPKSPKDDISARDSTNITEADCNIKSVDKKIKYSMALMTEPIGLSQLQIQCESLTEKEVYMIANYISNFCWIDNFPQQLGFDIEDIRRSSKRGSMYSLHQILVRWRYRTRLPRDVQIKMLIKAAKRAFPKKSSKEIIKYIKEYKKQK